MKTYLRKIMAFINDEEGASAIEYGLLVGLIAVVIIVAVTALGTKLNVFVHGYHGELCLNWQGPGPEPQGFGPSLTRKTSLAEAIGACSPSARRQPWEPEPGGVMGTGPQTTVCS